MDILGIDLTSVPWPIFLLIIITAFFVLFYINIHLPMAEDLETYKNKFNVKLQDLDNFKTEITQLRIILEEVQRDQNGISLKYNERISKLDQSIVKLNDIITNNKQQFINKIEDNHHEICDLDKKIDDVREKILVLVAGINRFKDSNVL